MRRRDAGGGDKNAPSLSAAGLGLAQAALLEQRIGEELGIGLGDQVAAGVLVLCSAARSARGGTYDRVWAGSPFTHPEVELSARLVGGLPGLVVTSRP